MKRDTQRSRRDSGRLILAGLLLAALAGLLYAPAIGYEFVNYDDTVYVTENPHVRKGLAPDSIRWTLTNRHGGNVHPLTMLSHMLDVEIGGMDPGVHHRTKLVLHVANVLLLLLLLHRMSGRVWCSAWVAALFAAHPLNIQSIAWIAERKNLLSTTFWWLGLLAYLLYVRKPTWVRYGAVLVGLILGLAAKPMVVTFPLTVILIDYAVYRGWSIVQRPRRTKLSRLALEKLPMFALAAGASLMTLWAQRAEGAMHTLESHSFVERIGGALSGYLWYVQKMFWPVDLAVFYPLHPVGVTRATLAAVILAAVTWLVYRTERRAPAPAFGWAWYLLTMLPVIGLIQVGAQAYADRYAYVPLIGLFLMLAWGLEAWGSAGSRMRPVAIGVALIAVAALALQTSRELVHWENSTRLFGRAVEVTPSSSVARGNLGMALVGEGRIGDAMPHFRAAVEAAPSNASAHMNLANALAVTRKFEESFRHYARAAQLDPYDPRIPFNHGRALIDSGRAAESVERFREALRRDPDYTEARRELEGLLRRRGSR